MSCPFDRAGKLEQFQRDQAIAAQLARPRPSGPSRTECLDCDNEIPPLRRASPGILRCTPCQSIFEKEVLR